MSVARKEIIPKELDVGGDYHHLADSIIVNQIRKRTLKNGLIRFLKEKHPDDFPRNDKTENE